MAAKATKQVTSLHPTRRRILEVSGELFVTRSYAGASMANIANELGIAKGALYHHFCSKEEILESLLAKPADDLAAIGDMARSSGSAERVLSALAEMFASSPNAALLLACPTVLAKCVQRYNPQLQLDAIAEYLAGPESDYLCQLRARAAIGAVRDASVSAVNLEGQLTERSLREIVAIALSVLQLK